MTLDLFPYFRAWREKFGAFDGEFFLDSFKAHGARYSYFPLSPPEKIIRAERPADFSRAWRLLQNEVRSLPKFRSDPGRPPFRGGAVGILSYDAGRQFEPGWKTQSPPDPLKFPLLHFGIYRDIVCLDHRTNQFHFFAKSESSRKRLLGRFLELDVFSSRRTLCVMGEPSLPLSPRRQPPSPLRRLEKTSNTKNRYLKAVKAIKEWIASGDIYQANYSQRIERSFNGNSLDFFSRLRSINPSPYACYFRLKESELASCSPELLLKKSGSILETRPIAGTRPRGKNASADLRLKGELLLSEKERAEHIMLLDLERNDLGKVCEAGSVKVSRRLAVERYSHVMHIVSNVVGKMRKNENVFAALEALFPGGTITGCPKLRCMEILDGLEPVSRGPFYGSAGWISGNGDAEFNILIRSALIQNHQISFQVGSGIVADSAPKNEYEESLQKAKALLAAL